MQCRISVFTGRKRERSPRENPPNGDYGGFSHDDLSPRKDITNSSRKRMSLHVVYFCVAGRKVDMRKHEKVTIWRVFAWRPYAPPGDTFISGEFSPSICRVFAWWGEKVATQKKTRRKSHFVFSTFRLPVLPLLYMYIHQILSFYFKNVRQNHGPLSTLFAALCLEQVFNLHNLIIVSFHNKRVLPFALEVFRMSSNA